MSDEAATGTVAEPILTPEEIFKLGVICLKKGWPLLIVGSPGVGKTSIVHQIADYLSFKIKVAHPVVDSPLDYKGHPFGWMDGRNPKAAFIPYGDLEILIDAQEPLVYVADDLGQATDVVKAAWMQLMLARQINGHKISDHVVFIGLTNGKEHNAGVTRFLEPLKDRFHTIVRMKTDYIQWLKWAAKNNISHEVTTWIRMNPQFLDGFKPTQDFSRTPTPRANEQLSDLVKVGMEPEMQLRVFAGTIGTEAAVNFKAHLEYYTKIEDPDLVLAAPEKANIPDEPALLYALCGALAAKADKRTIEPILKYAERLDNNGFGEFSMMVIKDAVLRNPSEIVTNTAFQRWASTHQEDLGL